MEQPTRVIMCGLAAGALGGAVLTMHLQIRVEPAVGIAAAPAHAASSLQENNVADLMGCAEDTTEVFLGDGMEGGTIELLAPQVDTDAMAQRVYEVVSHRACVPLADFEQIRAGAGAHAQGRWLRLAHDPRGRFNNYRSRLDYEVPMGEDIAPPAPSDMRFAEIRWGRDDNAPIEPNWRRGIER